MDKKRNLAIDILTHSFKDNGSVNYVVGHTDRRIRLLMQYSYLSCMKKGDVIFHESQRGVLLYHPSDEHRFFLSVFHSELKLAVLGIGPGRILKVLRRESYIAKHRWKPPHLYLWFIGTSPDHQGIGIGTNLMKKMRAISNQMDRSICLETSNPKNLPFYQKFGFKVYHEAKEDELGYTLWFMKSDMR